MATRIELLPGVEPGPEVLADALAQQRARMLRTFRDFDDEHWQMTSRCSAWTIHDVVRHLVDVMQIDSARFRGEPPAFEVGKTIDPRNDPSRWLEASDGQTPAETLAAFEVGVEAERAALAYCIEQGNDALLDGPYGPLHWSVLGAHVFWDAWLHERDIVIPLETRHDAEPHEDRLAALYGLAVASVAPTFTGATVDIAIELTGAAPGVYEIVASRDSTSVTADGRTPAKANVTADARTLLDALTGRDADPLDVISGPKEVIEPLTWLSTLMAPAD